MGTEKQKKKTNPLTVIIIALACIIFIGYKSYKSPEKTAEDTTAAYLTTVTTAAGTASEATTAGSFEYSELQTIAVTPTAPYSPSDWEEPTVYVGSSSGQQQTGGTAAPSANWYEARKNAGSCKELRGRVLLYCVFVDEPGRSWTSEKKQELRSQVNETVRVFENEAAAEGVPLTMSAVETNIVSPRAINWKSSDTQDKSGYVMGLLRSGSGRSTYGDMYRSMLGAYNVDSIAFVLLTPSEGRGFAHNSGSGDDAVCEHAVMFGTDLSGLEHEVLHLFGAIDYYYPEKVRVEAKRILGDNVMLNKGKIDDYTKYLIGWDDAPTATARAFLDSISSVTNADAEKALKEEWEADYVEKKYDEGHVYMGPIHNGQRNGSGKMIYSDGAVYEGDFVDGVYSGQGKLTYNNGTVYEGGFANGKFSGYGKLKYSNGDVYEGYYTDGKKNGQGKYTYRDGGSYEGGFAKDKFSGYGKLRYANGDVYEGYFSNDKKSGQGRYTFGSGGSYEGGYANGKYSGHGKLTHSDGSVYEGDFVNGVYSGYGKLIYGNGAVYEGYFANGKCNGKGRLTFSDGTVYEGDFVDDKRQGYGVVVYSNGTRFEGYFNNNEPVYN